mmetsp:Transcript_98015/g.297551  ORF Transcript_98015/g.297551 Transcript_98015/m.297551 type:complete len:206 (-) Transcript_98015:293-910(-)
MFSGWKDPRRTDQLDDNQCAGGLGGGLVGTAGAIMLLPAAAGPMACTAALLAGAYVGAFIGVNGAGSHSATPMRAFTTGFVEVASIAAAAHRAMSGGQGKGGDGKYKDDDGEDARPPFPGEKDEGGNWTKPPRPGGEYKEPFPGGPKMPPPRWEQPSQPDNKAGGGPGDPHWSGWKGLPVTMCSNSEPSVKPPNPPPRPIGTGGI